MCASAARRSRLGRALAASRGPRRGIGPCGGRCGAHIEAAVEPRSPQSRQRRCARPEQRLVEGAAYVLDAQDPDRRGAGPMAGSVLLAWGEAGDHRSSSRRTAVTVAAAGQGAEVEGCRLPGLPGCGRLRSRPTESGVIDGDWREVVRLVSDKIGGRYAAVRGNAFEAGHRLWSGQESPAAARRSAASTVRLSAARYPIRMAVAPWSRQEINGLGPDGATHRKGYQS
jgi:hypothetical protein